jgi:catalase
MAPWRSAATAVRLTTSRTATRCTEAGAALCRAALALSGAADRYDHREDNDYYSHAGALFRLMSDEQKRC